MKFTDETKRYIENSVRAKFAPVRDANKEFIKKLESENRYSKLIQFQEVENEARRLAEQANIALQAFATTRGISVSRPYTHNRMDIFSYNLECEIPEKIAAEARDAELYKQQNDAIEEIILSLPLGGDRAMLDELLSKITVK